MKKPVFLEPAQVANKDLAARYSNYSGPYAISSGWQEDLLHIFPNTQLPDLDSIVNQYGQAEYGEMNGTETFLLTYLLRGLQPKTIVEVGTFYGRSTRIMAEESPAGARVLTVDLPEKILTSKDIKIEGTDLPFLPSPEKVGYKYLQSSCAGKITQLRVDATGGSFRNKLDLWLKGETIDFALLDAFHDYKTTKSLWDLVMPKLSKGGIIMVDDFGKVATHAGNTEYFLTLARSGISLYYFSPLPAFDKSPSGLFYMNLPVARLRK